MIFAETEACIRRKYTGCVEVCAVMRQRSGKVSVKARR